jgi:Icc-related predicted phosphoesterase
VKIKYASDLHLERMYPSQIASMTARLANAVDQDTVLVLAGDIVDVRFRPVFAGLVHNLADSCKAIVSVAGNHEYYRAGVDEQSVSPYDVKDSLNQLTDEVPNYYFLDNSAVTIDGVNFAGTTLWFDTNHLEVPIQKRKLNDYRYIAEAESFMEEEQRDTLNFLRCLRGVDVLVTHDAPTPKVHPKYASSDLNIFYYRDITGVIYRLQPRLKLAIHGHMHETMDYEVGYTRVVSNPYGYLGTNLDFNLDSYVEV